MNQPISRIAEIGLSVIAILLVVIRLLGFAFFGATNSVALAIPAVVLFLVVFLPLKVLSRNRWILVFLVAIYLGSYAFGGLDRMIRYGKYMPDALEFAIITYFVIRAVFRK